MYRTIILMLAILLSPPLARAQPPTVNAGPISSNAFLNAGDAQYAGGMKCDSTTGNDGTDDTAALQAAINAGDANHSKRLVMIPAGVCKTAGVMIHAPVSIQCAGRTATQIMLASGNAKAAITILITATDWASPAPFAYVTISDCMIGAPSRLDPAGQLVGHGIAIQGSLTPSPATIVVELWRDLIQNMPGDGVSYAPGGANNKWFGNVKAYGTEIAYPNRHGIFCNSGFDWQWIAGPIYGAQTGNNVQLSGCTNFRFTGVNMFSSLQNDVSLFNSDFMCVNCFIDITGQNGVEINNSGGQQADFVATRFRWPGTTANNQFSNIHFDGTNIGHVFCTACKFDSPFTWPGPTAAWSASAAHVLNDIIAPTVANGFKYIATVAGTSGATEPNWLTLWQANTAYTVGQFVRPITPNGFGYICTVAGTTGAASPVWPGSAGTVTDGTVTWSWQPSTDIADGAVTWRMKSSFNNIAFVPGNTGNFISDGTTRFDAGDQLYTPIVTGSPQNMFNSIGSTQMANKVIVNSARQNDGFVVYNGTGLLDGTQVVGRLAGSTATNTVGNLLLESATGSVGMNLFGGGTSSMNTGLTLGNTSVITQGSSTLGFNKSTVGTAPGAGGAKLSLVCGTTAGTAKLIAQAGTSATAVTIADNIGTGVTGC